MPEFINFNHKKIHKFTFQGRSTIHLPKVLTTRDPSTTPVAYMKPQHAFEIYASFFLLAFQMPNQGSRLLWEGGEDPGIGGNSGAGKEQVV